MPPDRRALDHIDALRSGPRKKNTLSDPLTHRGRHFGRTVHAFCNIRSLVTNGLAYLVNEPLLEELSAQERREFKVFQHLIKMCPGLVDRLTDPNVSEERVMLIADLLQKGANASRADDTKSMKGSIIDWITPPGQSLHPPINRKLKYERGYNHNVTGALLCPTGLDWEDVEQVTLFYVLETLTFQKRIRAKLRSGEMIVRGDQWPTFLYQDNQYDPENPWRGLLKSQLLVSAYKHVFTSPSSVDTDESKATKSGNARIHGMTSVTPASLAYIATQVRFALSSASQFSRTDTVTDSENFYESLFDVLEDIDERENVGNLIKWWNRRIFPHSSPESIIAPVVGSALDRIKQKRAEALAAAAAARAANDIQT
ncbi:hypothetical protein Hypma_005379 [Hypsizygus marmoreus]|uniref:Uncharacterized protein n=1 Tax=Hypsizygus marmoreus TaxID=39966 RepID=A0A369JWN0_HYPMA|nr:hypothetical protein Hypma_005379 [Hypsizygus marmoreus]